MREQISILSVTMNACVASELHVNRSPMNFKDDLRFDILGKTKQVLDSTFPCRETTTSFVANTNIINRNSASNNTKPPGRSQHANHDCSLRDKNSTGETKFKYLFSLELYNAF